MEDETVADRARLVGLALGRGLRGLVLAARRPLRSLARRRIRAPERLLIAPQDIRTADPTVAADVYSGYFLFDGKAVSTRGASPFEVEPPSRAWREALAGFGWLRHLRAADTALARANARALVGDWMAGARRDASTIDGQPEVVARRLLSWLSQAPLILEGADGVFYRRFTRSIAQQSEALLSACEGGFGGVARITALVALCEVALCAEGMGRLQRRASRLLSEDLPRQILADGGHVSRDPQTLLDLLLDLLPLRQAFAARGVPAPAPLLAAIDRMLPMVRCLRHGDGTLALFNGMGRTRADVLATVLAHDDARRAPLRDARYSGYQRLDAGEATLIADAGRPPPLAFAGAANAGTLSFELSHGAQRIVVNGGAPSNAPDAVRALARATASHSTLVLESSSSSRFARRGPLRGLLHVGPRTVRASRVEGPRGTSLDLSHDGYARVFGYVHARHLHLLYDGSVLVGEDRLESAPGASPRPAAFALRFHLHPGLRPVLARRGVAAILAGPGEARWIFEAGGLPVTIEESVFYAQAEGPRRAEQIVVRGSAPEITAVAWSLSLERARDGVTAM